MSKSNLKGFLVCTSFFVFNFLSHINAFVHIFKSNLDKAGNENMSEAVGVNTQLNQAPVFSRYPISNCKSKHK